MAEKEVKKPTLKEKIHSLVESYSPESGTKSLEEGIFDLIQRVQHPEQFCPECDDRMFVEGSIYKCLNCGYSTTPTVQGTTVAAPLPPSKPAPTGPVPKVVDEAINAASEALKEPTGSPRDPKKASNVRALVDKMKSGDIEPPTREDTDRIRGADPNVRDVNWV